MPPRRLWLIIPLIGIVVALYQNDNMVYLLSKIFSRTFPAQAEPITTITPTNLATSSAAKMSRTPVYFLSHGGPNLMEDTAHPAHMKIKEIGREITGKVKPKAIVVFSAHWAGEPKAIEVNTAESLPLIYDYYGFPPHYYEVQYPHTGSPELAQRIIGLLNDAGIKAEGVRRGLDHGVFVPFLVAFDPKTNPVHVPIVQVSLFDSDSAAQHVALGAALQSLRDEGVLIVCGGMTVHNLRDLRRAFGSKEPMPYAVSFDAAVKEAVEKGDVGERKLAMEGLLERKDARRAHPSFEHLLPVHVAAGAAGEDMGRQLWTLPEGSLGWGMYRFGDVVEGV